MIEKLKNVNQILNINLLLRRIKCLRDRLAIGALLEKRFENQIFSSGKISFVHVHPRDAYFVLTDQISVTHKREPKGVSNKAKP